MYRKCAGVGDRLNPQRGAPDINMKDAFLEFGRVSLINFYVGPPINMVLG